MWGERQKAINKQVRHELPAHVRSVQTIVKRNVGAESDGARQAPLGLVVLQASLKS